MWIYWATNSCAALSIPKLNEEQLHGLLEYEHHVHKTWFSCKGAINKRSIRLISTFALIARFVWGFLSHSSNTRNFNIFYPLCLSVNSKVTYLTFTSCWEAMATNSPSPLTNLTLTPVRSPTSVWVTRTCFSVVSVV